MSAPLDSAAPVPPATRLAEMRARLLHGVPLEDSAGRKNLLLLIQLRWIAAAGQIASIAFVTLFLGVTVPIAPMLGVILGLVLLNLGSLLRLRLKRGVTNLELFAALLFDVAGLTTQLYLSGGAANPFTSLYLLQVTLGAVLLKPWSSIALVLVTVLCFAGLTTNYRPLEFVEQEGLGLMSLHIIGMLICFALNAALLVVFVTRIGNNIRERDARLADLRQHAAEEDHIVRMGLLASGAAHELGTPLSTLSIILGDWRRMPSLTANPELADEIEAMQAEVRRCKSIVTHILMSAGEARGLEAGMTTMHQFLDGLAADWRATRPNANLRYENSFDRNMPIVSESTLRQVVFNVLDNAYEVSPDRILFHAARVGDQLRLRVEDRGPGFDPAILASLGKPYQSTKGRLGGGLGLFLVFNVLRKLGGNVHAENLANGGALVELTLPLDALSIEENAT
ncbi:ATP-binding protein [Aureimonas phyllosphaerae]|uniref:histidine kinase n=1 Tax=Aureimonas phyllosphaerae TaxID=1166078 RepID=A0A7W6BSQ2_9HYPH|nr:two-component system sensor histidine kinase RegB [Aureimonas phyllosphaerae]MBB3959623.1 two-component system sensor histidine kinase RegB [Aureimonas phyllosphaerae]SFF12998.1 two-component system, sensor histidine kinase RegB [Aureimonas phyllosphaerae]